MQVEAGRGMLVIASAVLPKGVADMLVREIMTSPACSVPEGAPLEAALKLMATCRLTGLPVVDGAGRLIGIITEADMLKADLEPDPRAHARPSRQAVESTGATVGQVMTPHPHTAREDSDVAELAHTFASTHWKSVPVVRGDILLGVVSRSDVIRAMFRTDQEIAAEIAKTFAETGLQAWHADVAEGVATIAGSGSERERGAAISIAQSVRGVRHVTSQEPAG
jgi:CBS domain-containing protein